MSRKVEYSILFAFFLLAFILRLYIAAVYYGVDAEGYVNAFLTKNTFDSDFKAYPNLSMWLYYLLSASLLFVIKDTIWATKIITILFSSASLLVIYFVAKRIYDRKVAFLSLFLLLIHPEFTLVSSVALREPVYTFFVFLGILFLIDGYLNRRRNFCRAIFFNEDGGLVD